MTIEEKAKRYDRTIERAKITLDCCGSTSIATKNTIYDILPELKESEDEKVRKWIIDDIRCNMDNEPLENSEYKKQAKKAITWLIKQGEPTDINPSEFDLRLNKLLKQFETLSKEELASSLSFYLNVVQNDGTYKAEEKQGEQKPTDEVESKFKVGDWIITPNNATKQIKRVTFGNYRFTDETFYNIIDTDNKGHLWTINDAKDGDVLQLGVVTAIFQKYIGNGNCKCYCSVCDGIFEIPSQDDDDYYGCHDATPATKEQRELLFKSMKDDGYEWDAEKKELDKIEQKPSWSEEDEDIRDTIIRDLKRLGGDMVTVKPAYKEEVDWLKSLKYRFAENNEELN